MGVLAEQVLAQESDHPHIETVAKRIERIEQVYDNGALFLEGIDWENLQIEDLPKVVMVLGITHEKTRYIGEKEQQEVLNVQDSFLTHLQVMIEYFNSLWESPNFKAYIEDLGLSQAFLHALVYIHDLGRMAFNGRFSLLFIDSTSADILSKVLPNFPQQYLHSIKWVTRQESIPEDVGELTGAQIVGLMLKAIDTLGKKDSEGHLMDPNNFFSENGPYKKWVELQKQNKRLPFSVEDDDGVRTITAEAYTKEDERLTRLGVSLIEVASGKSFSDIRLDVVKRLEIAEIPNRPILNPAIRN